MSRKPGKPKFRKGQVVMLKAVYRDTVPHPIKLMKRKPHPTNPGWMTVEKCFEFEKYMRPLTLPERGPR